MFSRFAWSGRRLTTCFSNCGQSPPEITATFATSDRRASSSPLWSRSSTIASTQALAVSALPESGRQQIGGGTVRDMILDDPPFTWVEHPIYLVIVIVAAVVTVGMSFLMHYFRHLFLILDALGLAVFSVLGTQIAVHLGHGFIIASVSAVISGVFGGVLRDLLSDRIPLVFSGEYYAAISLLAAALFMALYHGGLAEEPAAIITASVCFIARLAAIYFKKGLPVFTCSIAVQIYFVEVLTFRQAFKWQESWIFSCSII